MVSFCSHFVEMGSTKRIALSLLLLSTLYLTVEGDELRKDVKWLSPKDLTEDFLESNTKPVFMFIHKSWCGACKQLKAALLQDAPVTEEFVNLSKNFIMVSAADDDEPQGEGYAPDGGYIPRVLFLGSHGEIRPEIKSTKSQYAYYYSSPDELNSIMKKALEEFGADVADA